MLDVAVIGMLGAAGTHPPVTCALWGSISHRNSPAAIRLLLSCPGKGSGDAGSPTLGPHWVGLTSGPPLDYAYPQLASHDLLCQTVFPQRQCTPRPGVSHMPCYECPGLWASVTIFVLYQDSSALEAGELCRKPCSAPKRKPMLGVSENTPETSEDTLLL